MQVKYGWSDVLTPCKTWQQLSGLTLRGVTVHRNPVMLSELPYSGLEIIMYVLW